MRGVVHDASWAAVANTSVYLRGGDAFALSGIDGFELTCTAPGDVTLVVVHAGFRGLLHMETNERARHFTERVAKRRTGVAPSIHGNGHSRQLYAGLHLG